jgi:hypothetical protein
LTSIDKSFTFCKQGFVLLLRTYRKCFDFIQQLKNRYIVFDDEYDRIAIVLNKTKDSVKGIYRDCYTKLSMDCFFEIENIFGNHLLVNDVFNYVVMRFSVVSELHLWQHLLMFFGWNRFNGKIACKHFKTGRIEEELSDRLSLNHGMWVGLILHARMRSKERYRFSHWFANLYDRWFQNLWFKDSQWGRNWYECRQLINGQNIISQFIFQNKFYYFKISPKFFFLRIKRELLIKVLSNVTLFWIFYFHIRSKF